MSKRWLIVAAHPDDEAKASGLIFKERSENDSITILTMRLCGYGRPSDRKTWTPQEAITCRSAELEEATAFWNAKLHWWKKPYPGNEAIQTTEENIIYMVKLLMDFDPTHIITHHVEDQHPDHTATSEIVTAAAERIKWQHDIDLYYFDQPGISQPNFLPNCYIDISDPEMLAACLWTRVVHRSQTAFPNLREYIARFKKHGTDTGVEYAMAYVHKKIKGV